MTKKQAVNIHKRRHVVIAVIFNQQGEILLTPKHQPDSEFLHGKWQLPGLGMKRNETYEQTLKRIQEEFSVSFETQTSDPIESIVYRNKNAHVMLHIFICHSGKQSPKRSGGRRLYQNLPNVIDSGVATVTLIQPNGLPRMTNVEKDFLPELIRQLVGESKAKTAWISYEDLNPSDCTPLTMEIIEIARRGK